jgi:hypothetical protein
MVEATAFTAGGEGCLVQIANDVHDNGNIKKDIGGPPSHRFRAVY